MIQGSGGGDWLGTWLADAGPWLPGAVVLTTLASEDLACVTAGLLVSADRMSFAAAVLACLLGIYVSDIGLYGVGWAASRGLLTWPALRRRVESARGGRLQRSFARHGVRIVFLTRFVPGSRVPCYLAAGALGWSFPRFAITLLIAAVLWTPVLVGISAVAGDAVFDALAAYGRAAWIALPVALLAGYLLVRLIASVGSPRGRLLWRARWRRWRCWEYWPPWLVYLPVFVDQVLVALRRGSPTLYSSCNPAIPEGGLVLESKGDILDLLPPPPADGAPAAAIAVAGYSRLRRDTPLDQRLATVADYLATGRAVLKPDRGERGTGVAIVRDVEAAAAWLRACPFDAMVQRYVAGEEFGIVWRRHPGRAGPGELRSVAHKRLPPVLYGDGESTVEELVLADARQRAMLGFYRRRFGGRIHEVLRPGQPLLLGELGTHCRGASFHDARHLATPALRDAIDRFMVAAPGLDFGRFDVRARSAADLASGSGIHVLELNGVTGEPAHVYTPGYPLWRGIAELCGHWRAACETGRANRRAGRAPASSPRRLLRLLVEMRRRPHFEAPCPDQP